MSTWHDRYEAYGARAEPDIALDPAAFHRFFSYQLTTLTFNSKPVITSLTLLAHQHLHRMAHVLAAALDHHLRTCDSSQRLPALYLLDSISKNIGPPYIVLFSRFIERAFLDAYHAVDSPTKVKMEELLGTWRTGGADGGELFRTPDEGRVGRVQRGIETILFGASTGRSQHESGSYISGVQQLPSIATPGERAGVLFDVRRLLTLRRDQAITRPLDTVNSSQIMALQQLETLILDTQLTADQVHQIRGQLSALAPPLAPPEVKREAPSLHELAALLEPLTTTPLVMKDVKVPAQSDLSIAGIDPNLLAQLQGLAGVGGLSNLFASSTSVVPTSASEMMLVAEDHHEEEYDTAVLALEVQLSNSDLLKPRSDLASFVYQRLGLQCRQCGLRYFDSTNGQKSMDVHLDWHFTHKRRIREGAARAQGRSWFSNEEDWIHSDDSDLLLSHPDSTAGQSSKLRSTGQDRELLLKKQVLAPTEITKLTKPCSICKEKFRQDWSEADEEWVFYNAVEVEGVIYHATCHAEATASRLAARLKLEGSTRPSRESTPITTLKGKEKAVLSPSVVPTAPGDPTMENGEASDRKRKAGVEGTVPINGGATASTLPEIERIKRVKVEEEEEESNGITKG